MVRTRKLQVIMTEINSQSHVSDINEINAQCDYVCVCVCVCVCARARARACGGNFRHINYHNLKHILRFSLKIRKNHFQPYFQTSSTSCFPEFQENFHQSDIAILLQLSTYSRQVVHFIIRTIFSSSTKQSH
jgi:hypothetical protein